MSVLKIITTGIFYNLYLIDGDIYQITEANYGSVINEYYFSNIDDAGWYLRIDQTCDDNKFGGPTPFKLSDTVFIVSTPNQYNYICKLFEKIRTTLFFDYYNHGYPATELVFKDGPKLSRKLLLIKLHVLEDQRECYSELTFKTKEEINELKIKTPYQNFIKLEG